MNLRAQPMHRMAPAKIARRERRPVSMRGLALRESGTAVEILVLDLSYDGCGIAIPVALDRGEKVQLSVMGRGSLEAEVRWYAEGKAGLVFNPEEVVPEQQQQARKSERISLVCEVTTRRLGSVKYRVPAIDLSPEGCKIELVERPRIGEHMFVKFSGVEALDAQVCWIDRHLAGLRFEKALHPAVFDLLVERLRQEKSLASGRADT